MSSVYSEHFCAETVFLLGTSLPSALFFPFSFFRLGEGNGNPLQYSCLENPMGGGAWQATVRGLAKSRTRLSDFAFVLS